MKSFREYSRVVKGWLRKGEAYIKPLYLVVAFIVLLLVGFAADKARAGELSVEVGAGFLSAEYSDGGAFILREKWADRYSVSLGYISEQWVVPRKEPRTYVKENAFIGVMRHVKPWGCLELGIGGAWFANTSRALGTNANFSLELACEVSPRFDVSWRHFSNAGTGTPNMGQDILLVRYNF